MKSIEELEQQAAADGFWDDMENSQKILQKTGKLKNTVETYDRMCLSYEDTLVLIEMGDEEGDLSLVEEIEAAVDELEKNLAALRLQTLLTGEYDKNNAIVSFHPGAGGTEAQDWAQMLYRMYSGYARGAKGYNAIEPKHLQDKIKYLGLYLEFLERPGI